MVSMGIPHEVSGEYLAVNFRHERKVDATEATDPLRDRAAFIAEAWFEDERGERIEFLTQGQSCVCRVRVEINWELQDPTFVLAIESEGGARVFATSSAWMGQETGSFSAGEQVVFSVAFDNPLAPGPLLRLPPGHAPDRAPGRRGRPPRPGRGHRRDGHRRRGRSGQHPARLHARAHQRQGAVGLSAATSAPALAGRPQSNQGWRRFATITLTLAKNEFKVRYFGSVLGYLWSLMRPLMVFGVLYVVFTHVVRFGGDIQDYPLKLLLAIVLWSFFAEATGAGDRLARRPRGPAAEGALPARRGPALGRAHQLLQPGAQPGAW